MKSKKLGSSRLICPDTDSASHAFWPYRHGTVTALLMALSSPYSMLFHPSSLDVGRCWGGTGVTVTKGGNTWCQQPPATCSLKLPGKAPSSRWWPKAVRALQRGATVPSHPQVWCTPPHLSDTSSALLFTRHEQQQVIYPMSKQGNPPPKSSLEKPTLCPQPQSEPASFPQRQTQLPQHAPAFWQSPTFSCQSPDSDPGRAPWEGGCCATWPLRNHPAAQHSSIKACFDGWIRAFLCEESFVPLAANISGCIVYVIRHDFLPLIPTGKSHAQLRCFCVRLQRCRQQPVLMDTEAHREIKARQEWFRVQSVPWNNSWYIHIM